MKKKTLSGQLELVETKELQEPSAIYARNTEMPMFCGQPMFKGCKWLVWHYKNKANLGSDWGRSHESILHFRKSKQFTSNIDDIRIPYGDHTLKYPEHPQAETSQYGNGNGSKETIWVPNPRGAKPRDVIEIPTTCNGMHEKTPQPTQTPEE